MGMNERNTQEMESDNVKVNSNEFIDALSTAMTSYPYKRNSEVRNNRIAQMQYD